MNKLLRFCKVCQVPKKKSPTRIISQGANKQSQKPPRAKKAFFCARALRGWSF